MADDTVVNITAKQKAATPAPTPQKETKSGRGRKPGSVPKERKPLPANAFAVTELTTEESKANVKRRRDERSSDQLKVDNLVYSNYKKWVEKGRPMNWVDAPVFTWPIPTEFAEDAMFMVRKACLLYGRKPWFGNIEESIVQGVKTTTIPFVIIDSPKRSERLKNNQTISAEQFKRFAEEMGLSADEVTRMLEL